MSAELYSHTYHAGAIPTADGRSVRPFRLRTWDVDGNEIMVHGSGLPVELVQSYLRIQDMSVLNGRTCREVAVAANAGFTQAVRDKEIGSLDAGDDLMFYFEQFVYMLQKRPSATFVTE